MIFPAFGRLLVLVVVLFLLRTLAIFPAFGRVLVLAAASFVLQDDLLQLLAGGWFWRSLFSVTSIEKLVGPAFGRILADGVVTFG